MIISNCKQGSPEWSLARIGIPTASEFSKLVTSTGQPSKSMSDYARVLAAESWAGKPVDGWNGNKYTDRGKELEPEARAWYEFQTGQEVAEVGFVTDDLKRYGCSPDGLIRPDGGVEFKCCIAKEHIKYLEYIAKHHKAPSGFVAQCQGEMYVCELDWVDLVFYHPDLPCKILRQTPNGSFIRMLKAQIKAVEAERNIVLRFLKEQDNA